MSIWNALFGWLGGSNAAGIDDASAFLHQDIGCHNPANGLPMAGGNCCCGVDIAGNPYGTDLSSIYSHSSPESGSGWSGMPDSSDPFSLWGD